MSKVICDICGTTYPETADRCPICGAPRTENTQPVTAGAAGQDSGSAGKIKGGRFSSSNVKKRNTEAQSASKSAQKSPGSGGPDKTNRALLIVLLALLFAIVCVMLFIFVRFFSGGEENPGPSTSASTSASATEDSGSGPSDQPTESQAPADIPCVSLRLQQTLYTLDKETPTAQIVVQYSPENSTDELVFRSDAPSIVAVSADGKLTAVSSGNATVTITCGDAVVQCVVVVDFGEETTPSETAQPTETTESEDPSEPTEESTVPPTPAFTLDTYDVTMRYETESFRFNPSVPTGNITWSSDDPSVAKVENGRVTAVGTGITIIRAQYDGQERECIIRCLWLKLDTSSLSFTAAGESKKIDENSVINSSEVKWSTDNAAVATVKDGVVTAVGEGTATISGEYRGKTVTCTVTCAWPTEPAPTQGTETTETAASTQETEASQTAQSTEATTETGTQAPAE